MCMQRYSSWEEAPERNPPPGERGEAIFRIATFTFSFTFAFDFDLVVVEVVVELEVELELEKARRS